MACWGDSFTDHKLPPTGVYYGIGSIIVHIQGLQSNKISPLDRITDLKMLPVEWKYLKNELDQTMGTTSLPFPISG